MRGDLLIIDEQVQQLYAMVQSALTDASSALLSGDVAQAERVRQGDGDVDNLAIDTDFLVLQRMEFQAPDASDMHFLITALRIVPQLERSADLVEHIASYAASGLLTGVGPGVKGLVADMAAVASSMWEESASAWSHRDPDVASLLEDRDDELDVLVEDLSHQLEADDVSVTVGMKLALLARFYERLGDHAVHLARRIQYLVADD